MRVSKAIAIAALLLLAGCAQMSGRYVRGTAYEKALVLYEGGMFAEARRMALTVGKSDPERHEAHRLVSEIDRAWSHISQRHMELAEKYEAAGDYSRAVEEYSLALEFNPRGDIAEERISEVREAMRLKQKPDELQKARARKNGKAREPEDPEVVAETHYSRGKIFFDAEDWTKAVEEFKAAARSIPNYMDTKALIAKANREKARAIDRHMKKGIEHFQKEDLEKAVSEWDAVLALDPGNKSALDYRSRAVQIMERLKTIREKRTDGGSTI